jgi:hypothetical protein
MFATLKGELEVFFDPAERTRAIEKMRQFGEKKLSPNFLAPHGLGGTESWATFTADKGILIAKLDKLTEKTGLKSPQTAHS